MSQQMDNLEAAVRRNTDVDESAVVLLKGLKQRLDEAGTDPAKLAALRDDLAGSTDKLAAAISENTPATT